MFDVFRKAMGISVDGAKSDVSKDQKDLTRLATKEKKMAQDANSEIEFNKHAMASYSAARAADRREILRKYADASAFARWLKYVKGANVAEYDTIKLGTLDPENSGVLNAGLHKVLPVLYWFALQQANTHIEQPFIERLMELPLVNQQKSTILLACKFGFITGTPSKGYTLHDPFHLGLLVSCIIAKLPGCKVEDRERVVRLMAKVDAMVNSQ